MLERVRIALNEMAGSSPGRVMYRIFLNLPAPSSEAASYSYGSMFISVAR